MERILLVDRNAIVRAGIHQIVKDVCKGLILDDAEDVGAALNMVQEFDYQVVLIGLSLPDLEGLLILEEVRRNKPHLPVVIIGMPSSEKFAVKAFALGADGFVEANDAPSHLIQAVKTAAKGKKYVTAEIMDALVLEVRNMSAFNSALPRMKALSRRERQISELMANGITNKEIAWQLTIHTKTVSTYKSRILSKLKLKNLAELVKYQFSYT